jgi:hypothetical protein
METKDATIQMVDAHWYIVRHGELLGPFESAAEAGLNRDMQAARTSGGPEAIAPGTVLGDAITAFYRAPTSRQRQAVYEAYLARRTHGEPSA